MNRFKQTLRWLSRTCLALVSIFATLGAFANPPEAVFDLSHGKVQAVVSVQRDVTPGLMSLPDVLGTAVGIDPDGTPALVVYVDVNGKNTADVMRGLPAQLRGVAVRVHPTEKFRAYAGKPGGVSTYQAKQTPPIQLGTSGGWRKDLANGYCCGGTLGSLITIAGEQYILSNYHVFESDIVSGGNSTTAQTGDFIIQPGLIDVQCSASGAQNVATLVRSASLPGSNVDASIARVVPGMVRTNGSILGIGTLSATTRSAALSLAVKKSGRTTGLTRSSISGLNATISVTYENECAGGTAFTKTYTGQVVIANSGSKFLNSGDSGSLMVEDVTANPRAVGLLYAGSSTSAIANPIGEVLAFFGASMVGN